MSYYDWEGRHLDAVGRGRALEVNEAKTQRGDDLSFYLSPCYDKDIYEIQSLKILPTLKTQEKTHESRRRERNREREDNLDQAFVFNLQTHQRNRANETTLVIARRLQRTSKAKRKSVSNSSILCGNAGQERGFDVHDGTKQRLPDGRVER